MRHVTVCRMMLFLAILLNILILRILIRTIGRLLLCVIFELIIKSISLFIRARIALDVNAFQQVDIS